MSPLKNAAILAAAAAVGASAVAVHHLITAPEILNYETVKSKSEYKIGKTYGHFLVDPSSPNNRRWWVKAYGRWKDNASPSTSFSKNQITEAFGSSATALNRVCEAVYKKETTDIDFSSGDSDKHKLARDLLNFCSPLSTSPPTIKDSEEFYASGTIGSKNKEVLVSVNMASGRLFWDLLHRHLSTQTIDDPFFKDASKPNKPSAIHLCAKAYDLAPNTSSTSTETSPTESSVKKYCSLASQ